MAESPFQAEPIPGGRRFRFQVQAQTLARQQKQAVFGRFSLLCDEGAALGGDDSAPPPLAYFASAVAF